MNLNRILNTAETFFYLQKYKNKKILFIIDSYKDFQNLSFDLYVLLKAGIVPIVILNSNISIDIMKSEYQLNIEYKEISNLDFFTDTNISIIQFKTFNKKYIEDIISKQKIEKVFIINNYFPYKNLKGKLVYNINFNELDQKNVNKDYYLLINSLYKKIEFILISSHTGGVFNELFTHSGAGALITNKKIIYRNALVSDADEIKLLLSPYVYSKQVLEMPEKEILNNISNFYLETYNDQIISMCLIKKYTQSVEIGKLCTIPRYQGQGKAVNMIKTVFNLYKDSDFKYLFLLSTNEYLQNLLISIGFKEKERNLLDLKWQKNYDFSRASKAYIKLLEN